MKKISVFFAGLIFLTALFGITAFKPTGSGPSANGQGTLTVSGLTRHFAFHANTMPDGSVQGNGELTYTAGGTKIKFDISCLSVTGNTAQMSGIITAFPTNPTVVGQPCVFLVVDNGEGSNAAPDQITLLYYNLSGGGTFDCTVDQGISTALNPIEGGNIQVKP